MNQPIRNLHGEVLMTNTAWQERKENAIARGQGNIAPVYVDRAENAEIWDVEGKRYIDFGTGDLQGVNIVAVK